MRRRAQRRADCPSITEVVALVYCERKAVLSWRHGDKRPLGVHARALGGSLAHKQFEMQGSVRAAVDRRCFVATHLYGDDAPQTWALRAWRDRVLMRSWGGRAVVRAYYAISPALVRALDRHPRIAGPVETLLRRMVGAMWGSLWR